MSEFDEQWEAQVTAAKEYIDNTCAAFYLNSGVTGYVVAQALRELAEFYEVVEDDVATSLEFDEIVENYEGGGTE